MVSSIYRVTFKEQQLSDNPGGGTVICHPGFPDTGILQKIFIPVTHSCARQGYHRTQEGMTVKLLSPALPLSLGFCLSVSLHPSSSISFMNQVAQYEQISGALECKQLQCINDCISAVYQRCLLGL